ncbi:unnamed protein product [Arabidopsis halleri]
MRIPSQVDGLFLVLRSSHLLLIQGDSIAKWLFHPFYELCLFKSQHGIRAKLCSWTLNSFSSQSFF